MFPELGGVLTTLDPFLSQIEPFLIAAVGVFVRISAIMFLLPGFGERVVPTRVRLAGALAFAFICWPLVLGDAPTVQPTAASVGGFFLAEAIAGLLLGLGVRMLVFTLQIAGFIAAQSLSLSQMFGPGVAPDPEPTIATMLTLGGVALALSFGLHVDAAILIVDSYQVLPFGVLPLAGDAAEWTTARVAHAFNLAISLAMPFILLSFVYNLALGFINKAMPQLMVSFVGLPAITGAGILLLMLTIGAALRIWHETFVLTASTPLWSQ